MASPVTFATSARLEFRAWIAADGRRMSALWEDPRMQRANPTYVVPGSRVSSAFEKEATDSLLFAIIEINQEGFSSVSEVLRKNSWVGYVSLSQCNLKNGDAMISLNLKPDAWDFGLGEEAARWAIDHTFAQLRMHRISVIVLADNERAEKLWKKVGFVEEGRKRQANWQDGRWVDELSMGILDYEWTSREQDNSSK